MNGPAVQGVSRSSFLRAVVLYLLPDGREGKEDVESPRAGNTLWRQVTVSGAQARRLLRMGAELRRTLARFPTAVREGEDFPHRAVFSQALWDVLPHEPPADRYLLISPSVVPIDLAELPGGGCLGDIAVISHVFAERRLRNETLLELLAPIRRPLATYLLMCPMAMDRCLSRHLQDIVKVATELEGDLPVELRLQPRFKRARQALVSPIPKKDKRYGTGPSFDRS